MRPEEKAQAAKGPVEAMRMAEAWMNELSADDVTPQRAAELDAGVAVLEERFPDIATYGGSAEEFAQSRGHGTGSRGGKRKPDAEILAAAAEGAGEAAGKREKAKGSPSSSERSTRSSAGRGRREGGRRRAAARSSRVGLDRRSRQALRQTGIPGATSTASNAVLTVLGLTVGISLLYLLLVNAESSGPGRSAVAQVANGAARAVQSLILPIDPLRSVGEAKSTAAADPPTGLQGPIGAGAALHPGAGVPQTPRRPGRHRPKTPYPHQPHPA